MEYVKSNYTLWKDTVRQTIIKGYHIEKRWYSLHEDGKLYIKAGYPWDGPTGGINTDNFVLPSLDHDILTELVNLGLLPPECQALADEQLIITAETQEKPMLWPRRMWVYAAVRLFQINKKERYVREVLEVN